MKRFGLFPKERLKKARQFRLVYRKGDRTTTNYFVWFFLREEDLSPKLGITVTKAIGKAHERNRIKRQIRETFRLNKESIPDGLLVIKARISATNQPRLELREDLLKGIDKLKKVRTN